MGMYVFTYQNPPTKSACGLLSWIRFDSKSEVKRSEKRSEERNEATAK